MISYQAPQHWRQPAHRQSASACRPTYLFLRSNMWCFATQMSSHMPHPWEHPPRLRCGSTTTSLSFADRQAPCRKDDLTQCGTRPCAYRLGNLSMGLGLIPPHTMPSEDFHRVLWCAQILEPPSGVEPPTYALQVRCSTIELQRLVENPRHDYHTSCWRNALMLPGGILRGR